MRAAVSGLLLGLVILLAWAVGFPEAQAQRPVADDRVSSPDLLALDFDAGDGRQQITVIDPKSRVMAVYQVDRTTGALALRSVRNLQWDLQIEDFNSGNPTPREIRALTQQR